MIKFDFVSDLHIDSWTNSKTQNNIDKFINRIIPSEVNNVLIVAGDISHHNTDIERTIKSLKRFYKNIIIVLGNHDYWIINRKNSKYSDSLQRVGDIKQRISAFENVHILDGGIVNINGINYGGCTGWYDGEYGLSVLKVSNEELELCYSNFSDFKYIVDEYKGYKTLCKIDKLKLNKIIDSCQVIITHHIPNWNNVPFRFKNDLMTSFFYFDGSDLLKRCKGKTWVYGHTHDQQFNTVNGCELICNPLGYRGEFFDYQGYNEKKFPRMIRSYEKYL